ncbi:MAG: hypothetical protein WDZ77_00030 [Candidatus Pacearchaeota archaeon]
MKKMAEMINVRCKKCKEIFEKGSNLPEDEKAYFCARCDKNTGKVITKEKVNPRLKDAE